MTAPDLRTAVDPAAGLVNRVVLSDPDIYEQELERIFARCWLFVAHESQIPEPGDFVTTTMGEDPVIVARQGDGTIRAFLNSCRHRGMKLCRADLGRTKNFMCSYHGWTFDAAGTLVNVPNRDAYGANFDEADWGLTEVAQLDSYRGLVFATWDPTAPPLLDYLGDMAFYIDGLFDRRAGGTELIPGSNRWIIECNWKWPAEQFATDQYHAAISHTSVMEAFIADLGGPEALRELMTGDRQARQFSSPLGHGTGFPIAASMTAANAVRTAPASVREPLERYYDSIADEVTARLGDLRARGALGGHAGVFPNFAYLQGTAAIRVWHPRGPDRIEVQSWVVVDRDAPADVKEAQRRLSLSQFSPSGLAEQDDGENWVQVQAIQRGAICRRQTLNYLMGEGREVDDAVFPGRVSDVQLNDMGARGFYRRWLEMMTADDPWSPT
jgi:phenylpropionate dioxygenase-like ring-hydroxylating dioxygenase large terminal subunit